MLIDDKIWGFYSSQLEVNETSLKEVVSYDLPYYAVPTNWVAVATIPLTSNGKVDKRALRVMAGGSPAIPTDITALPALPGVESVREDLEKALVPIEGRSSSSASSISDDKEPELPEKNGFHGERWLRHRFFSLYRRLFSVVLIANLVVALSLSATYWVHHEVSLRSLATASTANLMAAILLRQEVVINMLFSIACSVPIWFPLAIRRHCARIFHIGGLHSGCASMSVFWFIAFTAAATFYRSQKDAQNSISPAALALSYLVLSLLTAIIVMALPAIRQKYHNYFEMTHRFAGWAALLLIWIQTILVVDSQRNPLVQSLNTALAASPPFWMLLTITGSIILPWLKLRKVSVRAEHLSDHAVRLQFDYATPVAGSFVRLSTRPLLEWHSFATVAVPGRTGFSLVVSNAGDWTKRQIDTKPTKLWVRGIPTCGVMRIAPLFKRIIIVATGSGIGPCLPVIFEKRVEYRVFWSTPNPRKTFGDDIVDGILQGDPNAVIWNTREQGKPDIVMETYKLYREANAEAVCIISNQKLTEKLVYAMESRGIPAYGAIWDS